MVRLIVIVKALHKRNQIPARLPEYTGIEGVVFDGFSFLGEEVSHAEIPDPSFGKWYRDRDGYFYWGGGLLIIDEIFEAPSREAEFELAQTFGWFTDLGVEQIWDQFGENGDEVTVAVLDTGYDIHNADLKEAVIGVKRFDNPVVVNENDFSSPLMQDTNGHGTFCASVIANRNKNGINIGIAPKCKLLIGKISESGGLPSTGLELIINGIEWAVQKGADIISISFGKFQNEMPPATDYLQIQQSRLSQILQGKRVLIFASSGDNPPGHVLSRERYPASMDGCVSVGATNKNVISAVTVLSARTIIHAQGEKVEAYWLNSKIEAKTGTSMSTPIIAGVAALAVSKMKKKNNGTWNPQEILNKIYGSGNALPVSNKKSINPIALFNQL